MAILLWTSEGVTGKSVSVRGVGLERMGGGGGEGVRVEGEGVRVGGEGVRVEGEGVRVGSEGVRVECEGVREEEACCRCHQTSVKPRQVTVVRSRGGEGRWLEERGEEIE